MRVPEVCLAAGWLLLALCLWGQPAEAAECSMDATVCCPNTLFPSGGLPWMFSWIKM